MIAKAPAKLLIGVIAVASMSACSAEQRTPPGYQGIVEHDDRHLGFRVGGQLREIRFDRGDVIEEGALIAVLDDTAELPILLAREADLARARATRWLSMILPLTHYLRVIRGIVLKGASFIELRAELVWLAGLTLILVIVVSMRFQKKLD